MNTRTICSFIFAGIMAAALPVSADTLELKNGQIIQGKFVGGTALNIRFQVNGQEMFFSTKDVLNIGFSDTSVQDSSANGSAGNAQQPGYPPAAAGPPTMAILTPETPYQMRPRHWIPTRRENEGIQARSPSLRGLLCWCA